MKNFDILDNIYYAHEYKALKKYDLDLWEYHVREVSYSLKLYDSKYFEEAGKEMSEFVRSGDVLVPIPSSTGDTGVNKKLCDVIAGISGVVVEDILGARFKRESNMLRGKKGLPRLRGEELGFYLRERTSYNGRIVFIDNVSASGATLKSAMDLIKGSRGLVYAKDLTI